MRTCRGIVCLIVLAWWVAASAGTLYAQEATPSPTPEPEAKPAAPVVHKLNVNFATVEELQELPGIGPKLTQALISGRPYKRLEDLLNISGIGPKTLTQFQHLIEVKEKLSLNTATVNQLKMLPAGLDEVTIATIVSKCPVNRDMLIEMLASEKKVAELEQWVDLTPFPAENCPKAEDRALWKPRIMIPSQPGTGNP